MTCLQIEEMRGVVYDIADAERELFKLDGAKDEADKKLLYLSPLEFDAAVNHNVPVQMPSVGSFVYSAIYPNDAGGITDYKMSHLTSCRLAVWQHLSKPLTSLGFSIKKVGMDAAKPRAMGVHTTVNKIGAVEHMRDMGRAIASWQDLIFRFVSKLSLD